MEIRRTYYAGNEVFAYELQRDVPDVIYVIVSRFGRDSSIVFVDVRDGHALDVITKVVPTWNEREMVAAVLRFYDPFAEGPLEVVDDPVSDDLDRTAGLRTDDGRLGTAQ